MSDYGGGDGWWQASDGKWYPPEETPEPSPELDAAWYQRRGVIAGMIVAILVVGALIVALLLIDGDSSDDVATTATPTPSPTASLTPTPSPTPSPSPTASPTPSATESPTATDTPSPIPTATAEPTETATETPTATATPTAEPPRNEISGDGLYTVGVDVEPGLYQATDTDESLGCLFARLSALDGDPGSVLGGDLVAGGPAVVEIMASDAGFEASGCGTWLEVLEDDEADFTDPSDGYWIVGKTVEPGTWTTDDTSQVCIWERLSGFAVDGTEVIDSEIVDSGTATVEIDEADAGFYSIDCGTWEKS